MKSIRTVWLGIILTVVGTAVLAYSYTQDFGQTVLLNENSLQMGGQSYISFRIVPSLQGKYAAIITGGVGSVGCCVDFFIVNDSSWNSWVMDPGSRDGYSVVHLNSSVTSSQSTQGEFSFEPSSTTGYYAVFVNDSYPSVSTASINASIMMQYSTVYSYYVSVVGLTILVIGISILAILYVKSRIKVRLPESMEEGWTR